MKREKVEIGLKKSISDLCNIPKDAALGFPVLTAVGKNEILIENYRGILEYNSECIRVVTAIGQIQIIGKSLTILYYSCDEMKINGTVGSIEYTV